MEKQKKLNVGMVGFGSMGKTHAFAIHNLPYYYGTLPFTARVAGLCTTSYERSAALCEQYGFGRAARDFDELIARDDIDIIDICTPNTLHADMICRALDAGKHVLCEKPLCVTADEAALIVEAEKRSGRVCGMVFNNRFMAPMLRAKQLIDEGRLGRILSFRVSYEHNSSTFADRAPGWKQTAEHGGGVLFDLGSHVIDLIRHLCGDFESVQGTSQIAFPTHGDWQTDADEAFYITARLKSGACGTITANKLATGVNDDLSLAIFGERGSIKYELMEPEWLYFYDNDRPASPIGGERGFTRIECGGRYPAPGGSFPSPKASVGWLRCHMESMYQYLSAVANGAPFSPSLYDGAYVQAVMQAARASDQNGGARTEVIAP
ncbi:MAG: Gfo/Idh/MocA family oxidoreductase [Clostridia bacterium]|nr:Gfo/Idh/MocA family oxidoreductase [Clostridia bacterium]